MKSRIFFLRSLLHLFFPYRCNGCGTDLLTENILFCIWCQASMPYTRFEFFRANPIEKIFWGRSKIQAAAAHLYFTTGSTVQHSLHLLKYKGRKELGIYFGRSIGQALKRSGRFMIVKLLFPYPCLLTEKRKEVITRQNLLLKAYHINWIFRSWQTR